MNDFAIETVNLKKTFTGFTAVNNLNLKVPEGSVYGFLGPNGAGKTTTLRMITGLSKPDSGEIFISGKPVKFGILKNRENIGYLPDVPSFYNWMRADEFLKLCGDLYKIDKNILKARIGESLDLTGLHGVKKKIGAFSRGMKQRLGIAQALINKPEVLLLDEPTSALDPIGRKEVLDIISELSDGMTIFFSTHILTDIERVCDRVLILDNGKIVTEDTLEGLKQQYPQRKITLEINGEDYDPESLINKLNSIAWVERAGREHNSLIITVNDLSRAQRELPRIISELNLTLKNFRTLESGLEDIFIKVVNND